MDKKNQASKGGFWKEKGFYISILCLAVVLIGVGFYAKWNTSTQKLEEQNQAAENNQKENENVFVYPPDSGEEEQQIASQPSPAPQVQPTIEPEDTPEPTPSSSPASEEEETEGTPVSASSDEKIKNNKPEFEKESLPYPVDGQILNDYTGDKLVKNKTLDDWRVHSGIDLEGQLNAQVKTVADGIVEKVYTDRELGCCILINHQNGFQSLYANLLENGEIVKEGDSVAAGDIIGGVGKTAITEIGEAAHLHFELLFNGEGVNPSDYFRKSNIVS